MQGARLQSIRADLHDGGCRRGSRAAWLAAAICSGAADHRWSRVSCAAAGGRRCAPPHEHPPYPSPTHHTTPERPPLTLRVLRRRRSQAASREEYDLLLLGGASLKRGCTAAAPSWRSLRTQLQTAASPRLNMPRLQDARQYSDMRACASVAAFARRPAWSS